MSAIEFELNFNIKNLSTCHTTFEFINVKIVISVGSMVHYMALRQDDWENVFWNECGVGMRVEWENVGEHPYGRQLNMR